MKSPIRILTDQMGNNNSKYIFGMTINKIIAYDINLGKKKFEYKFNSIEELDVPGYHRVIPVKTKNDKFFLIAADKLYLSRISSNSKKTTY